jgi:DNA (cytosine-5)-methyltransferase 1
MFRYIDLFCGIGGFHQGIDRVAKKVGFEAKCIFAADNDPFAAKIYANNYKMKCFYDLKLQSTHDAIDAAVGKDELTCVFGGFPCQPFSKAGNQAGFANQMKGTLFFEIEKIVQRHHPKFILLENVRNLRNHDNGHTWKIIKRSLEEEGYFVDDVIISPNNISSIPALRERFFILAYNKKKLKLADSKIKRIPKKFKEYNTSIYPWGKMDKGLRKEYFERGCESDLEPFNEETIAMWEDLLIRLKSAEKSIITPLWPHYFDSRIDISKEPEWKQKIIKRNQVFYKENADIYDE